MRILVLGGTSEASALARRLAGRSDVEPILSLAGRTARPAPSPIPVRTGGFGGVDGLAAYLRKEGIAALVDATHPFAARISANAVQAGAATGVPVAVFTRPAWSQVPGDRWMEVDDVDAAVAALGVAPLCVFLTVGRLSLGVFAAAPQHTYVIRSIDRPEALETLPSRRSITDRGPFRLDAEVELMRRERIEVVVSKNSGGDATYAKIAAARRLGLPVVLVRRPAAAGAVTFESVDEVLAWLSAVAGDRGVAARLSSA